MKSICLTEKKFTITFGCSIDKYMRILSVILAVLAFFGVATEGKKAPEKHEFQAEMNRLMDIIINSLYNHKEVFLRELVSNAHDAVEKARYLSLSDPHFLDGKKELEIRIEVDNDAKTLSITDTGVGMTKADLINNLGTVAKSGTTNFIEKLSQSGASDSNLIGQFGVGFYSAFLVADKVTVTSKSKDDKQYIWESTAGSSYTIEEDTEGEPLVRGTRVTLHIKDDALEFLSVDKAKEIVNKFSQFIPFAIKVKVDKEVEEEVPIEDGDNEEKEEKEDKDEEDMDVKDDDDEEEKPKTKKVKKTVSEWEHVNTAKPIWMRPKSNITEDDYNEFYKAISKDYQDPLAYTHFSAEGQTEFRSILFIPKRAPYDMMDNYWKKKNDIKLYVRRVMVADKLDDLIPSYLGFVKGVVDSDDLPLNVNRDQLQQSKIMRVISKKLVKKILDLIKDMAKEAEEGGENDSTDDETTDEDNDSTPRTKKERKEGEKSDWELFYDNYSTQLKLGCYEDDANRNRIAKVLRFNTWQRPTNRTSLDAYIKAAGEENKSIYYMSGDSVEIMQKSPALQAFKKKNIDVLLLSDNLDEPCIQRLNEYSGKKFVSIQKADVKLPETEEEKERFKKLKKMYKPLTEWWKEKLNAATEKGGDLGQAGVKIEGVVVSKRLVDSPCVVVSSQYGHSAQQERVMKAQAFQQKDEFGMMTGRKTLEINPNHPVIVDLLSRVKNNKDDGQAVETAAVLFQAALLDSGYELSDPSALVSRMYKMMSVQMGVDPEAPVTEIEIPETSEDSADDDKEDKGEEVDFDSMNFDDFDFDDDDDAGASNENHDKDEL